MTNNPLSPIEIVQLVEERFNDLKETNGSSTIDSSSLRQEVMLILMDVFGKENFDENGKFIGVIGSGSALPQEIKEIIYKLDDPDQGGLTINDLTKAKQILRDLKPTHVFTGKAGQAHPQSGYGIWTVDIVNEFLQASDLKISLLDADGNPALDNKKKPVFTPVVIEGNEVEDLDEPNEAKYGKDPITGQPMSWLQTQGAFQLPKEITDKDNALDMSQRGMYLLPYFHKVNNYDPNNPDYCQFEETDKEISVNGGKKVKEKVIPIQPAGHPEAGAPVNKSGLNATAAGVGKTTKDINHLVDGGENNDILSCPNPALCASAAQHHGGWLQTWGCVICQRPDTSARPIKVWDPVTKTMKEQTSLISHGSYPVTLNDLCYWKDENGQLHGKKGLSVLEGPILFTYLVRELWNTEKFKDKDGKTRTGRQMLEERIKLMKEPDKSNYRKWVDEAVAKFIPDGTRITFDECHFTTTEWQALEKFVAFLSKKFKINVRKMSATVKGIRFSTTSTYPRANLYMSSLQPKFTWQGEEYDLNEILMWDKFWLFLPNIENGLNEKQQAIIEKYDLSFVPFNQPFEKSCESVSFGMPVSTMMAVDDSKAMGFTPDIGLVILTNIFESSNLKSDWQYSIPTSSWNNLANYVQEIARCGRFRPARGKDGRELGCAVAITLSKNMEEFVIKPDLSGSIIEAGLSGSDAAIKRIQGIDDVNHLRASIALCNEDNKKWGLSPVEVVVGATAGTYNYPKWGAAKASFRVDPTLMAKHNGTWEAPKLAPDMARDIMDTMIASYIKQPKPADKELGNNNFPYEANVLMKSSLIEDYGLKAERVKQVLNGLIQQRLNEIEIAQQGNDKNTFKQNEEELFKEAAALYKLTLGTIVGKNITVGKEKTKDGKEFWAMKINYQGQGASI